MRSEKTIVYLISGEGHLPYLTVSLYSLRRWWSANIVVYAWPESSVIVRRMAEDKRLGIEHIRWEPAYRGSNAQFICKTLVMQSVDAEYALYIDADTLIRGDISPLFDEAMIGFAATQFNDWTTRTKIIRKRILRLENIEGIDQRLVQKVLLGSWPSVNGGIFACRPNSSVLPTWHDWAVLARSIFICDEVVLHALMPRFMESNEFNVSLGGKFNSSPIHKSKKLKDDDVVIWHFHGDSNVRANKSPKGVRLWMPLYETVLKMDVGFINEWLDVALAKNKHLAALKF